MQIYDQICELFSHEPDMFGAYIHTPNFRFQNVDGELKAAVKRYWDKLEPLTDGENSFDVTVADGENSDYRLECGEKVYRIEKLGTTQTAESICWIVFCEAAGPCREYRNLAVPAKNAGEYTRVVSYDYRRQSVLAYLYKEAQFHISGIMPEGVEQAILKRIAEIVRLVADGAPIKSMLPQGLKLNGQDAGETDFPAVNLREDIDAYLNMALDSHAVQDEIDNAVRLSAQELCAAGVPWKGVNKIIRELATKTQAAFEAECGKTVYELSKEGIEDDAHCEAYALLTAAGSVGNTVGGALKEQLWEKTRAVQRTLNELKNAGATYAIVQSENEGGSVAWNELDNIAMHGKRHCIEAEWTPENIGAIFAGLSSKHEGEKTVLVPERLYNLLKDDGGLTRAFGQSRICSVPAQSNECFWVIDTYT